ncbi:hypothetical protein PR048_000142 [Dryococelus australis]|uniref:Uncharacterized protein n=1 Tax=Dryococelus australis TaxID=614101 RepID=A0ABQ9IF32_9NEOP|nr:hypothetical protein PR048_000142 [Dryococelus australis]
MVTLDIKDTLHVMKLYQVVVLLFIGCKLVYSTLGYTLCNFIYVTRQTEKTKNLIDHVLTKSQ